MDLNTDEEITNLLAGKPVRALQLFYHLINEFKAVGDITLYPAKSMLGIANQRKRIAWVTQFGKSFIHVVFPFKQPYADNLCFQKIVQVPGDAHQFNHHFRMLNEADVNEEVKEFMRLAYSEEK